MPAFSVMTSFHNSHFSETSFVSQKWQREHYNRMKTKGVYSMCFLNDIFSLKNFFSFWRGGSFLLGGDFNWLAENIAL